MTTDARDEAPRPSAAEAEDGLITQLIDAARGGSDEELGRLLGATRRYLLMVADRAADPGIRAKVAPSDLVQETFVDAHRYFSHFEGQSEAEFFAWLCRILLNKINDAGRQYRGAAKRDIGREQALAAGSQGGASRHAGNDDTPSALVSGKEEQARLFAATARLPDEYQQVIRLRSWEQLSFADVGEKMNRSAEAARKLWFRAIQRLRRELEGLCDQTQTQPGTD